MSCATYICIYIYTMLIRRKRYKSNNKYNSYHYNNNNEQRYLTSGKDMSNPLI